MCPGINASATELRTTAQQIHALYGDTIGVSYSYGNVQHTTSAQFVASVCSSGNYGQVHCDYNGSSLDPNSFYSADYMDYDAIFYLVQIAAGETVVNDITITGLNTYFSGYARGAFLGEAAGLVHGLSPDWNNITLWPDNYANGFQAVCANYSSLPDLADYYGFTQISWNYDISIPFRAIPYEFENGGQITDIHFDSLCTDRYGNLIIGVVCPYYDGNVSVTPPVTVTTTATTTTTTTTGTNINVNVNVDMNETNGLLSGIKQGIDNIVTGIINGLKALFIPSDDFMDDFKSDMEDLAEDHLGGLYEAESILVDMFEQFPEVVSKNEIYIEPVNIPLAGETLTLGNWHVPLKVAGIPSIFYDGLAFIIDFLCLMAFLRMCRNKLEIFLNPDTEVIKE